MKLTKRRLAAIRDRIVARKTTQLQEAERLGRSQQWLSEQFQAAGFPPLPHRNGSKPGKRCGDNCHRGGSTPLQEREGEVKRELDAACVESRRELARAEAIRELRRRQEPGPW